MNKAGSRAAVRGQRTRQRSGDWPRGRRLGRQIRDAPDTPDALHGWPSRKPQRFRCDGEEMLRVLRSWSEKRNNKPMPEWELTRRLPWKPSDHDDVVKLLRKQKLIDFGPSSSKTRPGTIYWLIES